MVANQTGEIMINFIPPRSVDNEFSLRTVRAVDLPVLMMIDELCFDLPCRLENFEICYRKQDVSCFIAELAGKPVGYVLYCIIKSGYEILSLAVHPDYRFRGFGRAMLAFVATRGNRKTWCVVEDGNLNAHMFFAACGMKATKVIRDYREGHDVYRFESV